MAGVIAHEWIESSGGAEKVVEQMLSAFPGSDLYTLWDDAPGRFGTTVHESWMSRLPLRNHKALALPFMLTTWRRLSADERYDWVLSSSHLFAHHARFRGSETAKRLAYVHTPARYIWAPEYDPRGAGRLARAVSPILRTIDRSRAQELDKIASNSKFISERIAKSWRRESEVIYPPVDVQGISSVANWRTQLTVEEVEQLSSVPSGFVLGASRFVPQKGLDLVLESAERAGIPVVIAGRGPEETNLRRKAEELSVPVRVIVSPSDAFLYALYQQADVLVFPSIEDFGIVPVEAQALGTPVVCGPIGGQTETIVPGISGVMAESLSSQHLANAIRDALELSKFDGRDVTARFDAEVFKRKIREFVLS